jgi:dimethylargininase
MRVALAREVSPSIERCELTHLERTPIDFENASAQHRQYVDCLAGLGCRILVLPAQPDLPDAVFVEDTAVVLDELAVITRPGAESRREETISVARALQAYRELYFIERPGTLDGGDVLRTGRTLFAGLSGRTNRDGIGQLQSIVESHGYEVIPVEFQGCLHLKSAVTPIAADTLLINPRWARPGLFTGWKVLEVDPAEPMAANALLVDGKLVYPAEHARTRTRIEKSGIQVLPVPMSELAKAEGGVTCCSLIVERS